MPRQAAKPNSFIIAGSNGAGQTTFATEFLPLYVNCRNFINPDLIARASSPFDPDAGMPRAGSAVLERIAESTAAGKDFAFETTLAGHAHAPLLRRVQQAGFTLQMFYRWLLSAGPALRRIRDRVESGGHSVPERDVRRRFGRTLGNLFTLYRPLLDTLHFFDNSSDTPRLAFKDEAGQTSVASPTLYAALRRQFES
jgi:predicted ABC-type ATPase